MVDDEIVARYLDFYRGGEWAPSMSELADLSSADMSRVTPQGLAAVAEALARFFKEADVAAIKTAVFSPTDLPFGLARADEANAEESPESVRVFRGHDEALRRLTG